MVNRSITVSWHGLALQLDIDGALYWPEERLLVAADLHLEKGTSYASSAGRLLPPYDSAQTVARLERLIDAYRPLRVVALGDSFHDRRGAARLDGDVAERIRRLSDRVDWIWIHGNHDPRPPQQLGGRVRWRSRSGRWYSATMCTKTGTRKAERSSAIITRLHRSRPAVARSAGAASPSGAIAC